MILDPSELPDTRQFNTFVAVVERGGFSAAARALSISQPTVSQQMRKLEQWVGRPIFGRPNNGPRLTPDGEALLAFARALVATSRQAFEHFHGNDDGGIVRLGLNEVFALTAIPRVLALYASFHARCELTIETSFDSPALFAALDAGRLDCVVARTPTDGVRGRLLATRQRVWLGRSADLRLSSGTVPIVTSTAPSLTREAMFAALTKSGRTWSVRFRSQNLYALDAAVAAGVGVAASMQGLRTGAAVPLGPECGLPPLPDVALCLDARTRPLSPAVGHLTAFLEQLMSDFNSII